MCSCADLSHLNHFQCPDTGTARAAPLVGRFYRTYSNCTDGLIDWLLIVPFTLIYLLLLNSVCSLASAELSAANNLFKTKKACIKRHKKEKNSKKITDPWSVKKCEHKLKNCEINTKEGRWDETAFGVKQWWAARVIKYWVVGTIARMACHCLPPNVVSSKVVNSILRSIPHGMECYRSIRGRLEWNVEWMERGGTAGMTVEWWVNDKFRTNWIYWTCFSTH